MLKDKITGSCSCHCIPAAVELAHPVEVPVAKPSEFDPQDPHGQRRECALPGDPVTSAPHMVANTYPHVCTKFNKFKSPSVSSKKVS